MPGTKGRRLAAICSAALIGWTTPCTAMDGVPDWAAAAGYWPPGAVERWTEYGPDTPESTVYPARLVDVLPEKATASRRKVEFISTVLPLVLRANDEVLAIRRQLEVLAIYREAGIELDADEQRWLEQVADRYDTESGDIATLMRRVDVIPPSLAVAQAAEESGWGTSRFARAGNALFGQRVWRDSDGIVPAKRAAGETHKVRRFDSAAQAVRSYIHNLNTHFAYADFRRRRAEMRRKRSGLDAYSLADALRNYSERRDAYLRTIRSIMSYNGLHVLDRFLFGQDRLRPDA